MNDFLLALLVYSVRDGLLLGVLLWVVVRLVGHTTPAPVVAVAPGPPAPLPKPVPGPVPGKPPVVVPAAQPKFRFAGITATSFAGTNDDIESRTSAYDGKIINGDTELAAALSCHFPGEPPALRVGYRKTGRVVDVPTRDVGPWNTNDRWWETGARPAAEAEYRNKTKAQNGRVPTNPAGLDLSPAVWAALGYVGNAQEAQDQVDFDFVSYLDAGASPVPPSPATDLTVAPPWLVLMRKLRDMGVHAQHDSAIILSWPPAIGNKFSDMAAYAAGYVHDTTPWCGLTVAYVLAMSGIRPQFGAADTDRFLWADSWRQFGTPVTTPQPGDVMVFQWAGGGHHVTLYDHEEPSDNSYHCTGGNQGSGHVVSTEALPIANCIGIRRPPQQQ